MNNAVCYKADSGKIAGPRLRCFLNAGLLSLVIGSSGAMKGYAATTCPDLPQMNLSQLQGTVYGQSGVAVPQITVQVIQDGKVIFQAQTDDRGKFAFKVGPGNFNVHVQFLGSKSLDLNVRVGHGFRGGFFHAARLRIVLALSGARCSYATTSAKQFKNEIRRYKMHLEEVPNWP